MKEWRRLVLGLIAIIGFVVPAILWDKMNNLGSVEARNIILVLWAGIIILVALLVRALEAWRTWIKTAQNINATAGDARRAEEAAYRLFCIVFTPDKDSVPDARYLHSWSTGLLRVNGEPHKFLGRLKLGIAPKLPFKRRLQDLSDIQRRNLLEVIDSYRQSAQPVR